MDDAALGGESDDQSSRHRRIDRQLRVALGGPREAEGVHDRYVDLRDPSRGGMAVVYRATDVELGREVAYKVINEDLEDLEEYRRLFDREAEITARLQHPGIVPVFGRMVDGSGRPAYAMGYVEGINFAALARQWRPLRERLAAFRDACRIVEFAHDQGYAHCDISAKNLMIADDGTTYVVDWGLARRCDRGGCPGGEAGLTGLPEPYTPGYSPPGAQAGGPRTFATDVYGLGAVLAALVLGVTPHGQPDLDGPGKGTAPRAVRAIINAAMVERPDGLYRTAGDLADDVGRYLDGEPVRADSEPWREWIWRSIRKNPARTTLAASTLLLLLVSVASAAMISSARSREMASEQEGLRQKQEADSARREALWSRANEAMLRSGSILDRNPTPGSIDPRMIEPILKVLSILGKKPALPVDEAVESLRSQAETVRRRKTHAEAQGRAAAEPELRKVIATLERLDGEFPEPRLVRYHLAKGHYGLATLEFVRTTNELGFLKNILIFKAGLEGRAPDQPEVVSILARLEKALELIPLSSPPPSEPSELQELEKDLWTVRAIALARLGRFTECLISFDRALGRAEVVDRPAIRNARVLFLIPAEAEQSHMPWSRAPRVDHDRAIGMAEYLVAQPGVSPEAVFNAACAFSLASLDQGSGSGEVERRAKRAVALIAQIEQVGYFKAAKKADELVKDDALEPLRRRPDFRDLAARVAGGR